MCCGNENAANGQKYIIFLGVLNVRGQKVPLFFTRVFIFSSAAVR